MGNYEQYEEHDQNRAKVLLVLVSAAVHAEWLARKVAFRHS